VTPDSSVIVAAFAPWHPLHRRVRAELGAVSDVVAHAELEAYSVLTRLPAPFRADATVVAEYLRRRYPGDRLVLGPTRRESLLGQLAAAGITGGKTYDALIAITANDADRELLTCDRRAVSVYERLRADFRLVAESG
jgi:predicted nucleic acid-binding protein